MALSTMTDAKGTVHPPKGVDRTVIIPIWREASLKARDSNFIVNKAQLLKQSQQEVDFGMKSYVITWTPSLGFIHFAPEPIIAAFSDNCWPQIVYDASPKEWFRQRHKSPSKHVKMYYPDMVSVDKDPHVSDSKYYTIDLRLLVESRQAIEASCSELGEANREMVKRSIGLLGDLERHEGVQAVRAELISFIDGFINSLNRNDTKEVSAYLTGKMAEVYKRGGLSTLRYLLSGVSDAKVIMLGKMSPITRVGDQLSVELGLMVENEDGVMKASNKTWNLVKKKDTFLISGK